MLFSKQMWLAWRRAVRGAALFGVSEENRLTLQGRIVLCVNKLWIFIIRAAIRQSFDLLENLIISFDFKVDEHSFPPGISAQFSIERQFGLICFKSWSAEEIVVATRAITANHKTNARKANIYRRSNFSRERNKEPLMIHDDGLSVVSIDLLFDVTKYHARKAMIVSWQKPLLWFFLRWQRQVCWIKDDELEKAINAVGTSTVY